MGILNIKLPPYLPSILLLVALVIALVMAYRLWRELKEDDEPASPLDLLGEFEEAHAAGELDEDELRRVRESLRRPWLPAEKGASADKAPGAERGQGPAPGGPGGLAEPPTT